MSSPFAPENPFPDLAPIIAKITDTWLGYEDHGIFSLNLNFDYGGSGQGAGGYCVCSKNSDDPKDMYGVRLIKAICDACGVRWEQLKGRTVIVYREPGWNGQVRGIGPLPTEKGKAFLIKEALGS